MYRSLLKKIASHLDQSRVPYMLIGGQAVLLYGEPRLTRDVDVTLGIDLEGLPNLLKVVREMDLQLLVEDVEQFVGKTWVLPTFAAISLPHCGCDRYQPLSHPGTKWPRCWTYRG